MCWLCCCSSFVCGAMAAAAAHNPPQTKAINQHKTNPPQQNNNSISLLAFHAQPQRKELFCVLLWLAAELLAPWGGLHSQTQSIRSLPSSLNYFISFHNSKQRRKQAQVDWFVRSTLSFSFICFHWVGVVALFLSAEPWSAAALITHPITNKPKLNNQSQLPLLCWFHEIKRAKGPQSSSILFISSARPLGRASWKEIKRIEWAGPFAN